MQGVGRQVAGRNLDLHVIREFEVDKYRVIEIHLLHVTSQTAPGTGRFNSVSGQMYGSGVDGSQEGLKFLRFHPGKIF